MTEAVSHHGKFLHPHRVFTVFKWLVYFLLAWNAVQFFHEDLAASAVTFNHDITWHNVVEAFSASIDTTAWLVLLLVFEFETAILTDEKLKGGVKWFLAVLKVVCYLLIIWSFYGYLSKYLLITDLLPFSIADVCSLVGTEWSYVVDLDDYLPIDASACAAMQGQELFQVSGTEMVGTREALKSAWGLAVIDIINAGTWLVIVVLLETEVWMQLRDALTDRLLKTGKYLKGVFYSVLFAAAVYWGFEGSFLDFWDAFLWLVAFVLIELNIFQWHEEVEEEHSAG
ncbi:hypothetical protein ACFL00_01525 [Pseudomonadota bacterium]